MNGNTDATAMIYDAGERDCIEKIKLRAYKMYEEAGPSHDFHHCRRVYRLCLRIGKAEGADLVVLSMAAYLHDIGRPFQDASGGVICHAEKGAELARPLLKDVPISQYRKENILHCIKTHRFRTNASPETLEAKALFDADKLDAIGAVGVARAFLFAGEVGASLENSETDMENTQAYSREDTGYREFKVKLSRIKDRMQTGEGQRIARERHRFMESFFRRFFEEIEGIL